MVLVWLISRLHERFCSQTTCLDVVVVVVVIVVVVVVDG